MQFRSYNLPSLCRLQSLFTIRNTLTRCDTTVHLLLSAGLICCPFRFYNVLFLSRTRLWRTGNLDVRALAGRHTSRRCSPLTLLPPQGHSSRVAPGIAPVCPSGQPSSLPWDTTESGIWRLSGWLCTGLPSVSAAWVIFLSSGRAVHSHTVAFLKTSPVGQPVVTCLRQVTGHFQVPAAER